MSELQTHTPWALHMEKISANGETTTTGWGSVDPTEKVSAIYDRTMMWGGWRTYRHAYGVQKGRDNPIGLKWTPAFTPEYDPTVQELFKDINIEEGQSYFSLFSKLDVKMRYDETYSSDVERVVHRFQDLYMHLPRIPVSERAAPVKYDAIRPTSARERDTGGGSHPPNNNHRPHRPHRHPHDAHASISELIDALIYY
jgi:hypothetical protein